MGHTIWIEYPGIAQDELSDHSIMERLGAELDRLSGRLGVAKLSGFYDYSALEEAAYSGKSDQGEDDDEVSDDEVAEREDDEPDDEEVDDVIDGSTGNWFDPTPALAAVRALFAHLTEQPTDLNYGGGRDREHWPTALLEELSDTQAVLERAEKAGKKIRLLIVA